MPGLSGILARTFYAAVLGLGVSATSFATATFTGPGTPTAPGQAFETMLSLDAFAGIEAVDVTFNFDQALLSLDNVELAPGVPVPFLPLSFEPGLGQNKVGFFYINPLLAGSGALLRATFTALGATPPAGTFINPEVKINEDLQSLAAPLAVAVVPEPGSFVLILAGLTLLAGVMRWRTRRPAPVRSGY